VNKTLTVLGLAAALTATVAFADNQATKDPASSGTEKNRVDAYHGPDHTTVIGTPGKDSKPTSVKEGKVEHVDFTKGTDVGRKDVNRPADLARPETDKNTTVVHHDDGGGR